jgi:hypothetical protein
MGPTADGTEEDVSSHRTAPRRGRPVAGRVMAGAALRRGSPLAEEKMGGADGGATACMIRLHGGGCCSGIGEHKTSVLGPPCG